MKSLGSGGGGGENHKKKASKKDDSTNDKMMTPTCCFLPVFCYTLNTPVISSARAVPCGLFAAGSFFSLSLPLHDIHMHDFLDVISLLSRFISRMFVLCFDSLCFIFATIGLYGSAWMEAGLGWSFFMAKTSLTNEHCRAYFRHLSQLT